MDLDYRLHLEGHLFRWVQRFLEHLMFPRDLQFLGVLKFPMALDYRLYLEDPKFHSVLDCQ